VRRKSRRSIYLPLSFREWHEASSTCPKRSHASCSTCMGGDQWLSNLITLTGRMGSPSASHRSPLLSPCRKGKRSFQGQGSYFLLKQHSSTHDPTPPKAVFLVTCLSTCSFLTLHTSTLKMEVPYAPKQWNAPIRSDGVTTQKTSLNNHHHENLKMEACVHIWKHHHKHINCSWIKFQFELSASLCLLLTDMHKVKFEQYYFLWIKITFLLLSVSVHLSFLLA
jgi:hypothetical protein